MEAGPSGSQEQGLFCGKPGVADGRLLEQTTFSGLRHSIRNFFMLRHEVIAYGINRKHREDVELD